MADSDATLGDPGLENTLPVGELSSPILDRLEWGHEVGMYDAC